MKSIFFVGVKSGSDFSVISRTRWPVHYTLHMTPWDSIKETKVMEEEVRDPRELYLIIGFSELEDAKKWMDYCKEYIRKNKSEKGTISEDELSIIGALIPDSAMIVKNREEIMTNHITPKLPHLDYE